MDGVVAAVDIGKTNMKVLAFDASGRILAERACRNAPLEGDVRHRYLRLDTDGAWRFLVGALRELTAEHAIEAVSVTTHGAAGVLVTDVGVALPPMDYEYGGYDVDRAEYEALRPPFEETLSPSVPRGLNLGRQIYHLFRHYRDEAATARAFLCYPQYWAWRLSGVMASEVTSLGTHTDLWNPRAGELSSMVDALGWRSLFPPLRRAYESLGKIDPQVAAATGLSREVQVFCGVHDSNASLSVHLKGRSQPFTVISTGTWVIVMAVGAQGRLEPSWDMLANVDVRGGLVPTARFMGGREFAALAGESPPSPSREDIAAIVEAGVYALPSFSDQGGPFAARAGRIEGPAPTSASGRAALATLYVALMTTLVMDRLGARGDIIVEGSFARGESFASVLAAAAPTRRVSIANAAGAAAGAAGLARWEQPSPPAPTAEMIGWEIPGLAGYQAHWLEMIEA